MDKYLIFNADDFGASKGINRGILECYNEGVLTSTSLMVTGKAAQEAVSICRDHPGLAVGLHWDVWGEDEREFDIHDLMAVRDEFERQLEEFERLVGKMPTHVDSHKHAHMEEHIIQMFQAMVEPLGIPLRGDGRINFIGGFYAQWEWLVTNLEYVSVPFLQKILSEEVHQGWTEISCHPGYVSSDFYSVYNKERETEIDTLTDILIQETIDKLNIRLVSYADYVELNPPP